MNRITTSRSALGAATVLTVAGLVVVATGAPSSTETTADSTVSIELVGPGGGLRDGEVTTTIHSVVQRNGRATTGEWVRVSTEAWFEASLADGEYLITTAADRPTGSPASTDSAGTRTDGDITVATPATPPPAPEPEPAPVPELAPAPEPAPEPEPASASEWTPSTGCDTSDDAEIRELLWADDGAIRWLVGAELMTLWPEPGMQPIRVCQDAHRRLTELGVDVDYFDAF